MVLFIDLVLVKPQVSVRKPPNKVADRQSIDADDSL